MTMMLVVSKYLLDLSEEAARPLLLMRTVARRWAIKDAVLVRAVCRD